MVVKTLNNLKFFIFEHTSDLSASLKILSSHSLYFAVPSIFIKSPHFLYFSASCEIFANLRVTPERPIGFTRLSPISLRLYSGLLSLISATSLSSFGKAFIASFSIISFMSSSCRSAVLSCLSMFALSQFVILFTLLIMSFRIIMFERSSLDCLAPMNVRMSSISSLSFI